MVVAAIGIRLAVILGGYALALLLIRLLSGSGSGSGDANIGAGLLAFGLAIVVSALWAWRDGRAHGFSWAAAVWIAVAVLLGVGAPLVRSLLGEGFDADIFLADLGGSIGFALVLVAAPALVAGLIGSRGRSPS